MGYWPVKPKAAGKPEQAAITYPDFITITCYKWFFLLHDPFKTIITDSLAYLVHHNKVRVYGFVIMTNHVHLIWQMLGDNRREDVQRDFLKFTAQQMLKHMRYSNSRTLQKLLTDLKDRKYQIWQRKALSIPLYSYDYFMQKLGYIHNNPVKANICHHAVDYKYSSASFYKKGDMTFDFLTRFDE
jgi:putative transposase